MRALWSGLRDHLALLVDAFGARVALSIALTILGGVLEFAAVGALILVLSSIGVDVSTGQAAALAGRAERLLGALHLRPGLELAAAAYAVVVILQSVTLRAQTLVNLGIEYRFVARLRRQLFEAVAGASWPFLARSRGADLSHALTTELDRVGLATYQLLWTAATAGVLAAQVLVALRISVPLTLLVAGASAIVVLAVAPAMRHAREGGTRISAATADVHAMAVEQIGGMKTVKSQSLEPASVSEFAARSDTVARVALAVARQHATARAVFEIGSAVLLALVLVAATRYFGASPATLVVLVYLSARVMPRVSALQTGLHQYASALPALAAVQATRAACAAAREHLVRPGTSIPFATAIRLDDVTFGYGLERPVVHGVSLEIRCGETAALVGPSGGGKTTVADLVMGLLTPRHGRVLVDGEELGPAAMASWRASIGYVPQDSFFFHDTIRNNLRVAAPGAADEAIEAALQSAACHFVAALPAGLDTVIGDRGIRLSGGERQRLALARALVRRPRLLILDEATSALDAEHEERIFEAIDALHGQLTILLVTHRVWTLHRVDTIHVIEAGRLVQSGGWDTLRNIAGSRIAAPGVTGDTLASPRPGTGN